MNGFKQGLILMTVMAGLAGCQLLGLAPQQAAVEETNGGGGNEVSSESQGSGGEMFSGSFFDLIGRGGSVVCNWSMDSEEGMMSGTSYVSGERLRSEATMSNPVGGGEMDVNTLVRDGYVYSWTSLANTGTKFAVPEDFGEAESDVVEEAPEMPQDLSSDVDFQCQQWRADESVFGVPTEISFQDLSQMMESVPTGNGSSQDVCALCNSVPEGEAREACLANCQ